MSNHLIIGLGGTGGKVIRNIRKAIYRDWRPSAMGSSAGGDGVVGIDKVAQATPPGLKVDYLYVDSSKEQMGPENREWKVLGENLQLTPSGQCHLQGSNLKTRMDDIHGFPALAPWIGSPQNWRAVLNLGTGGAEILGGQKRRLGRFLFAANADSFIAKVNQKAAVLKEGSPNASVQFHIVAGLAGGTGSGTLIDAVCMIRKEYPDSRRYPILLYLLLPDEHPKENWNTGNYHANGYAALIELNALGVGQYMPYDLRGSGGRYTNLPAPFKICYLITNENSNGAPFDVDRQVPAMMAETLYQMLMAESMAGQLNRVVEWENMEISHEGRSPNGGAERCRLFASFGIKKISYPEEEIKEFIGYSLSSQTLLQVLYNNWAQGYLDQASKDLAVEGLVADGVTQKRYNLDREVLFLERQFSTEDVEKDQKGWKTFDADWKTYIEKISEDITGGDDNWLAELKRKCEDRQKKNYRDGRGVMDYYSWKKDRIPEYVRFLVAEIENDLGSEMLAGSRSLVEVEAILRALCSTLEKKQADWDQDVQQNLSEAANKRLLIVENTQRFEDLGYFGKKIPGNKERIFEAGKSAMIAYFTHSTRGIAWDFASDFVRFVKAELLRLADRVANVTAAFRAAVAHCSERAKEHRPVEQNLQSTEVLERLFNGDEVTRYVDALIGNKEFQDKQARQARQRMVEKLMAGRMSLRGLPTVERNGELLDILAQSSHETLMAFDAAADASEKVSQDFGRLLGVSIIDKLRERYAGNSELMKREIRDHMGKAGYLLRINEAEHGKQGPGADFSTQNKKTSLIVMLPDAEKDDAFVKELRAAFQSSVADANTIQFIDTKEKRRHEITILSFVQLFPVRYAEVLGKLREKCDARLKEGDGKQRILELHSEDPSDRFRPLFVPPVREVVGPTLLLGLALGSVRPKSAGGTAGSIRDDLVAVDSEEYVLHELGRGFDSAMGQCASREIHDAVTAENGKRASHIKGDAQENERIRARVASLAKEIAGDDDDARKMMRSCQESALAELEGFLGAKRP